MRRTLPIACLLVVSLSTTPASALTLDPPSPKHDWSFAAGEWSFGLVEFEWDSGALHFTVVLLGKTTFITDRPAWQVAALAAVVPVGTVVGFILWPRRRPYDGDAKSS